MRDAPRFVAASDPPPPGREASILHRLGKGAADIPTMVRAIYIGLDPRLTGAAGLPCWRIWKIWWRAARRDRRPRRRSPAPIAWPG